MIRKVTHNQFGTLTVTFDGTGINIALPNGAGYHRHLMSAAARYVSETSLADGYIDPTETREEYGERLRRAASTFGRAMEKQLLDHLRQQGHLVD